MTEKKKEEPDTTTKTRVRVGGTTATVGFAFSTLGSTWRPMDGVLTEEVDGTSAVPLSPFS